MSCGGAARRPARGSWLKLACAPKVSSLDCSYSSCLSCHDSLIASTSRSASVTRARERACPRPCGRSPLATAAACCCCCCCASGRHSPTTRAQSVAWPSSTSSESRAHARSVAARPRAAVRLPASKAAVSSVVAVIRLGCTPTPIISSSSSAAVPNPPGSAAPPPPAPSLRAAAEPPPAASSGGATYPLISAVKACTLGGGRPAMQRCWPSTSQRTIWRALASSPRSTHAWTADGTGGSE